MKKTSKTVVFFGSGPVAAKSLALLLQHTQVEAVVTKPTTLQEMAKVAGNIPVLTVQSKKELNDLIDSEHFTSDLGVLIDFGIIVSHYVISYFPLGIVNSHFSILPEWRGADPITFAILSGQKLTGVSLMMLVEKMDEGPIIAVGEQPIHDTMTTPELTQHLILLSDALLKVEIPRYRKMRDKICTDQAQIMRKYNLHISYSRKLVKEDGIINWGKAAAQIEREVRAFIEWPKSRTVLANRDVIITSSHIAQETGKPGVIFTKNNRELLVYCREGALAIDRLKPAGKREMAAQEFLAGYKQLL